MMAFWNQLIWIFFPIPIFSLVLLSIPGPAKLEKIGTNIVHYIFFSRISFGSFHIRLLEFFSLLSLLIFASCIHQLHMKEIVCATCRYEAETYWYKKAMKFRAQRNFWLSLFNVFLWILVWRIHNLKGFIIKRKDRIRELEAEVKREREDRVRVEVDMLKSVEAKKEE